MNALKLKHENEIKVLKDQIEQAEAQDLRHETDMKELKTELEKAKGEIVRLHEELEKSQKDRDDALVFLAEQDVETAQLKEKLKQLGHPVETETEDDYDDDDAQGDEEELVKELIEAEI
jgi:chromosome segregation ATPase